MHLLEQGAARPGRGPEVPGVHQGGGDVRHVPAEGEDAARQVRHHKIMMVMMIMIMSGPPS